MGIERLKDTVGFGKVGLGSGRGGRWGIDLLAVGEYDVLQHLARVAEFFVGGVAGGSKQGNQTRDKLCRFAEKL